MAEFPLTRRIARLEADVLDFAPGILKVQQQPPSPLPRLILYSLIALLAVLLLWAVFGRLDIIAVAEGKLVPQSALKIVQPSESGIVQEILVHEGQEVSAGQVMMRMDMKVSDADGAEIQAELERRGLQLRRIDAELGGTPLRRSPADPAPLFAQVEGQYRANRQAYEDALGQERAVLAKAREDLASATETLSKLNQVLPVYQAQEQAFDKLARDGYAGKLMALDHSRERIEKEQDMRAQNYNVASLKATIEQSDKKQAQITSNYRQQLHNERADAQGEYQKAQQEWIKQQHRNALLELRAPQAGIVKDIATHTQGTVVSPGTILMTLVPQNEPLEAEVWIDNQDAGFVHAQQKVKVKLLTFQFQKYGMLDGSVTHVGADASDNAGRDSSKSAPDTPTAQPPKYKGTVTLAAQYLDSGGTRYKLQPGMQVAAEINLGQRTVLEYLLSPVQKAFHEAGRER
jgi:hemolysin D